MTTDLYAATTAGTAPAFSTDGRTVYHLRGHGMPGLWAMAADGSNARPVATPDEKVAFLRRAPRDDRLVYGIDAGGDERQQLWLAGDGEPRPLTANPSAIHDFGAWSPDGTAIAYTANDRDAAHMDVIVHPLAGEPRRIHLGAHQLAVATWHPDGTRLALLQDDAEGDQSLAILHLDGTLRPIAHPRPAAFRSVRWARDGSHLLALSDGGGEYLALCRIDPATGATDPWVAMDGADIEAWSLSPDGTRLATVTNERGYGVLRIGPPGEPAATVPLPPGVAGDLAWSPDGATLAFSASTPTTPPGLYVHDAATRPLWQPDPPPSTRSFDLVAWPATDGRTIPGWFATPASPQPPAGWPAIVWVHGGPASQARANWRPDMQMLLDQGIAVLMPNVRGSTGYGRTSTASDDGALRPASVQDLAGARSWLAAQPGIDPARIGIVGQSYGGYMVLAAITGHPALWRTAIDYYGIADFRTLLANTGPWRVAHRSREYADPHDPTLFDRLSPLHRAGEITCPLLVLHGTRDPRVPYTESQQITAALHARSHPVQFETYTYAGHGFIRPEDRRRTYATIAEYLARTL